VAVILVAAAVDTIRSSEPSATERSAAGEVTIPVEATPEGLPRCTVQNIAVSIEVLGGTATVVVRHVGGRACHLAALPVRLSVTNRVGTLAGECDWRRLTKVPTFSLASGATSHLASSSSSTFPTAHSIRHRWPLLGTAQAFRERGGLLQRRVRQETKPERLRKGGGGDKSSDAAPADLCV